jgi:hypothetical protein
MEKKNAWLIFCHQLLKILIPKGKLTISRPDYIDSFKWHGSRNVIELGEGFFIDRIPLYGKFQ